MTVNKNIRFSTEEIFELAKRIEVNGEKFYRLAAKSCPDYKDFLLKMADQEKIHKSIFEKMSKQFVDDQRRFVHSDDNENVASYLNALADYTVFNALEDPEEIFINVQKPKEIFRQALSRESETILFFIGIKDMMISNEDKEVIDLLIKEEMTHIVWIKENFPK